MARVTIHEAIEAFGRSIGLADLAFDSSDRASFTMGEIAVTCVRETEPVEAAAILIDLGPAPDGTDAAGLNRLLEAGFVVWARNWMTVGLDDEGARVIGRAVFPAVALDENTLDQHFSQMLACAEAIRAASTEVL